MEKGPNHLFQSQKSTKSDLTLNRPGGQILPPSWFFLKNFKNSGVSREDDQSCSNWRYPYPYPYLFKP